MEHSATFARLFARLVGLLIHETENVDEQKVALRAATAIGREGAVRIRADGDTLYADGEPMLAALPGATELAARLSAGGVREIEFEREPAAGEMLRLARTLAEVDPVRPDASALEMALQDLGASTLRFVLRDVETTGEAGADHTDDAVSDAVVAGEADASAEVAPAAGAATISDAGSSRDAVAVPVPKATAEPAIEPVTPQVDGLVSQNAPGMFFQFSSIGNVKDSPETLLARLSAASLAPEKIRLLDDAVTLVETAAREGKGGAVVDLMRGLADQEASAPAGDVSRAFVMALRRLAKPLLLRTVAAQLVSTPARRDDVMVVLVRMGQDGAEAVIDQLSQAATTDAKRDLLGVLRQLEGAVPALVHMLGDARWFVARNAADLLGELRAERGEEALVQLLHHADERVRRSATNALMQIGSDSAREAVRAAVRDDSPQVRMQAAFAVASHPDPRTATTLITAIDAEQDHDVQLAMLLALGRVGTSEAVERLIKAAEPERGFFRKKATAFRVAAVQALAEVNSPAAHAALRTLAQDKEKEVRDTVVRLGQRGRRPVT